MGGPVGCLKLFTTSVCRAAGLEHNPYLIKDAESNTSRLRTFEDLVLVSRPSGAVSGLPLLCIPEQNRSWAAV